MQHFVGRFLRWAGQYPLASLEDAQTGRTAHPCYSSVFFSPECCCWSLQAAFHDPVFMGIALKPWNVGMDGFLWSTVALLVFASIFYKKK